MNKFGGNWTKIKIEILVEYAQAYLEIMKDRKFFELMYFDGFAGSGFIIKDKKQKVDVTIGAARRIIEISKPRSFDSYYFVEKDPINYALLEENTKKSFPQKKIHIVCEDCNNKIIDLGNYLRNPKNKKVRTLAYVDPCGMQVDWRSIESLRGLAIDMWILVPTGLGVGRLLKNDFKISSAWMDKLKKFLGLEREEIEKYFYKKIPTLYEEINYMVKEKDAIERSAKLYQKRLKEVFEFVSEAYVLKNSSNSVMYHLFLASNNKYAQKIGNSIIKKYNNIWHNHQ